jgi:hypothetical protein
MPRYDPEVSDPSVNIFVENAIRWLARIPNGEIVVAATDKISVAKYSTIDVQPQDLQLYGTVGFKYNSINVYYINMNLELDDSRRVATFHLRLCFLQCRELCFKND